jgi:hypothetical protein
LSANPAIALNQQYHGPINQMQIDWGIKNSAIMRSISAEKAIADNFKFMIDAGVPDIPSSQVTQDALKFAKELPCP